MSSDELEQEVMRVLSLALDQPSEDRAKWVSSTFGEQPELVSRVLKLLHHDASASSLLRTGGARADAEEPEMPDRAGNYRILELIGQGGMGAVYKAERDVGDFEHTAAIKIIRPGLLSDALTARFAAERQTLANLNHPGIAKLFDGGTLPDGSPYFAMELVDGISLAQWRDAHPSDQDPILDLFEKICDAVAYAHQNLIIHRDLTPSNVLVTPENEIKLIDFGIAKPQAIEAVSSAAGSTSLASLSFTPGFAAPERSQGAPANTLSDVYSLGKLLEALLKSTPLDRDLKAIITRASALAPEDRYASVLALQADLQRFRNGYPVSARNGGTGYRFGKYLGRRRWLVGVSTAVILALIGAFGITLIQYQRAEAALERANARFEQARALSRALIFETYDAFSEVSGTLEPRRNLAGLVSAYIDELAADKNAPDDVLFDIGQINSRLADLYGGLGMANLGDTDKSLELLLSAEAALEQLVAKDPANTGALSELVFVRRGLAMQHLIYQLDPETAHFYNQKVRVGAARGADLGDENAQTLLRHFWSGRTDRLQILLEEQDLETALQEVQLWRSELTEDMYQRLGGGEEMAAYLAVQEAEILNELDRPAEAIAPLKFAQTYRQEQLQNAPDNYYQQTQLMVTHMELARVFDAMGNTPEAISESESAIDLARAILAQDPSDAGGPEGLNSVLQNHAAILKGGGREQEAVIAATEALSLARDLARQFPDDAYYQDILLNSLLTFAEMSETGSDACAERRQAQDVYSDLETDADGAEDALARFRERLSALNERGQCGL